MDENKKNLNNQGELKTLRTYMTDMADIARANEVSVIKVALAEQNRHEREDLYRKVEGTPVKKVFWFIGGILLIGVAILGFYFLSQQKGKSDVIKTVTKVEPIIFSDETKAIILTDSDNLQEKIKQEKSLLEIDGSIRFIPILKEVEGIEKNLGINDLFSRLSFSIPSSLVRSLSDSYMIGTYQENSLSRLFFIFESKDYEYSYAGMLEWENTLARDMTNLFDLNTREDDQRFATKQWKDILINNRDVRVLIDEEERPILYYLFTDKSNIIVADSDIVIKEIIARLIMKK